MKRAVDSEGEKLSGEWESDQWHFEIVSTGKRTAL